MKSLESLCTKLKHKMNYSVIFRSLRGEKELNIVIAAIKNQKEPKREDLNTGMCKEYDSRQLIESR